MNRSMTSRCLLLGILVALLVPGWSLGQKQLASDEALKQGFDKSRETFYRLLNQKGAPAANDLPHLDAICKYYVYRTTIPTWQNKPDELGKMMVEFERSFIDRLVKDGHKDLVNAVGKLLVKRLGDVLNLEFLENRQACVLTATMLPMAAKLKQDDFGEFLVQLVQSPKYHDAVKLYALKGLREFLPVQLTTDDDDPKDKRIQQRKDRDVRRIGVILGFLGRKWPVSDSSDKLEMEGAVRYLRKEALATLAQVQAPVVYIDKKGTRVEGPAVFGLVLPLVKDGLQPPASVAEKCEAALGLCGLKAAAVADYQADAGVYLVGQGLLALANGYREDLPAIAGGQDKKPPRLPWKIYAERFLQELKTLEANARGTPANPAARALAAPAREVLQQIKAYQQIDVRELEKVVTGLRPKTHTLFKNVKEQPHFDWDM